VETSPGQSLRIGVTAEDITGALEDLGPFISLGIALPWATDSGEAVLAADWLDLTSEFQSMVNVGVEFRSVEGWALRGGLMDGEFFTAGAGYGAAGWCADVSWQESAASFTEDTLALTIAASF
jgi:hypothetical protein